MKNSIALIVGAVLLLQYQTFAVKGDDFDLRYMPEEQEGEAIMARMLKLGTKVAYRTESEKQKIWIYQPEGLKSDELRPCILYIHGGGWGGIPDMFAPQCLYFARRGMVAATIHFRGPKEPKGKGSPKTCLADARSAYRWIKENGKGYNIDPDRIVVSGGSAGGHLSLGLVTLGMEGIDNDGDNLETPIDPKALILYNPAFDLVDGWKGGQKKCVSAGMDPASFSPAHFVKPGLPDTLILSGSKDTIITPKMIHDFVGRMEVHGNKAEFVEYEGAGHSFYNYHKQKRFGEPFFIATCEEVERFLAERGFL